METGSRVIGLPMETGIHPFHMGMFLSPFPYGDGEPFHSAPYGNGDHLMEMGISKGCVNPCFHMAITIWKRGIKRCVERTRRHA